MWNDMEIRHLRSAIVSRDSEQQFFWVISFFCGLDKYVPVPILLKTTSIDQVILPLLSRSLGIFFDQVFVWELLLWVLVQEFGV